METNQRFDREYALEEKIQRLHSAPAFPVRRANCAWPMDVRAGMLDLALRVNVVERRTTCNRGGSAGPRRARTPKNHSHT